MIFKPAFKKWRSDGFVPFIKSSVQYSSRKYFHKIRPRILYLKYHVEGFRAVANPWKTIHVDPDDIEIVWPGQITRKNRGEIRKGDWDQNNSSKIQFEESPKFQAVKSHFVDGIPWEETGIYDYLLKLIKSQGQVDGCHSRSELVYRYENEIERLYQSITTDGYKSQVELGEAAPDKPGKGEPGVCIGRNGQLILAGAGGWHRVSIAKIADVNTIPVQVLIRHYQWQMKREEHYTHRNTERKQSIEYSDHPDIVDLYTRDK